MGLNNSRSPNSWLPADRTREIILGYYGYWGASTRRYATPLSRHFQNAPNPLEVKRLMDYSFAISYLLQSDPVLAKAIAPIGDCQLDRVQQSGDVFNSLARAIIYQQLSTIAATTIYNRFCQLYVNKPAITAFDILDTPEEVLRGVGISRFKISYLKDLATKTMAGLPTIAELETMDNESIIKTLTQIKGVGRWTVQMLLIFRLHRCDVLPVDDRGVRAAIRRLYALEQLPDRQMVEKLGQKWQPYAAIACWYLWRTLEMKEIVLEGTY